MALHRSSLAAAISMAISSGLMIAADAQAEGYVGESFAKMMDDTGVNLELRNFYFNRDFRNKQLDDDCPTSASITSCRNPDIRESWAQGARLNIESGYFMDLIGIDAAWYGSLKLQGKDDKWGDDQWGSGALRTSTKHYDKVKDKIAYVEAKQKSYDKLGQVFLKTRFGDESLNAHINAGRMFMDTGLLNDSDSRVTPSTTQAIYADINWDAFTLYGFSSDKASAKTQSGFHKYKGPEYDANNNVIAGKEGDWKINSIGATFDTGEGYGLNVQLAKAKDYKKMDYLNAYYTLNISEDTSILFDGYYYKGKGDGKYLEKVEHNGKLKEWDSKLWNLVAQLKVSDLKFAISYQKVDGDFYDYLWGGSDDSGLMTWNAVQYWDFNNKDEKSWMAKVDYDFASLGLPGLNIMTRYVKGEYHEQVSSTKKMRHEWERDTDLRYAFQDGALKGLTITLRNATFRTYGTDSLNENRLIVDYTIALL